jgi:uncharacterized protein involved in response to NO
LGRAFLEGRVNVDLVSTLKSKSFFELAVPEPFRIFFPIGLLLGAIGVALWPLFVWHAINFYPRDAHLRLMIEGLMGSFIIGFLGTAGPRLLDAPPFRAIETYLLLALQLAVAGLQLKQRRNAGDIVFLLTLVLFLSFVGKRARTRQDLPPPNFVLVILGFLNAIAGIVFIFGSRRATSGAAFFDQFGSLLLNEGFVLFPILGVGAFFFPKLLGGAKPEPADLNIAISLWKKRALIAALTGVVIWISFVLEALEWTRTAAVVRGSAVLFYFALQGHLFERPSGPPFLAHCFRFGAVLLIVAFFFPLALPTYRLANMHLAFIGGFTIILFTVSTRVILGHSGYTHLFQKRLYFLIVALVLLIVTMLARVGADFFPPERNSHLVYAALIWLMATAIWAWALLPKLLLNEEE